MTSADVRNTLVHALGVDLIGPDRDDTDLHSEVLPQAPSRWYLTGFLIPTDAPEGQKGDDTASEDVDQGTAGNGPDEDTPEPPAARRGYFPSSIGMSLLVPKVATELQVTVRWGDYVPLAELPSEAKAAGRPAPTPQPVYENRSDLPTPPAWRRIEQIRELTVKLTQGPRPLSITIPDSGVEGLRVVVSERPVKDIPEFADLVPTGTRSVSVFLVNVRKAAPDAVRDAGFIFQASLAVRSAVPFVPRPNLRGLDSDDWDERVADLQYRDTFEYAVGHGISTHAVLDEKCNSAEVHTRWIPTAQVERVAPADIPDVVLGMEELAELADAAAANKALSPLVAQYRTWLGGQKQKAATKHKKRQETINALLGRAGAVANRIEAGIALLDRPVVFQAFRLANKVMAISGRQRSLVTQGIAPDKAPAPKWRPFQLAFLLMNLPGIVDPTHDDREVVDLLFFPTGGGKTEAYLGLAAFTLVYRRLTATDIRGAGLSVLMRYTLRLLTLDQLGRAATLICALELERQEHADQLGEWPFEIGLWVGRGATPNEMGNIGDQNENSARTRTIRYITGKGPSPIPLEECPWCGKPFNKSSFQLIPNQDHPTNLVIRCVARKGCPFGGNFSLPMVVVDEPIYHRLPCFLIATVDKFAAMPWTGPVGGFFGRVDRFDKNGFYGPCDPGKGQPIPGGLLPPPDLIIQDELHLISGPMGTMVGLYETALDELSTRTVHGRRVRPKIVASTATVRRARNQIRALFCRREVDVFPPPGPDRRDSFFAITHRPQVSHPRAYVGLVAQGRSLKVVLLRTYLALLGATQKAHDAAGGKKAAPNPADPYLTLLGYFNSLRELGGSRRIVEDEVRTRLGGYANRKRDGEATGLFASRKIAYEVVELTSRVSTDQVAGAKRRLALPFSEKDHVDVALATNMISVGLDITRLGLMVVLGQPKTSAEYIQATSRVGRDAQRPGLVVTIMNIHRPRDRSHYERFAYYHETFYRSVEASSVTPFSPRALDRGLAGTLVALARQHSPAMAPPRGATSITTMRGQLEAVAQVLADRAAKIPEGPEASKELREHVIERSRSILDEWEKIAKEYGDIGTPLVYQENEQFTGKPLLHSFLDPELKKLAPGHQKFRANRSMRDVEPSVNLWVRTLDNIELAEDEE